MGGPSGACDFSLPIDERPDWGCPRGKSEALRTNWSPLRRPSYASPAAALILIDAGPLVALVDRGDQHHVKCAAALAELREPLATVWPPFVEAMYLLSDLPLAQEALWEMLERGAVLLLPLDSSDVPRIRELMRKYASLPMDLADASLLRVAEREGLHKIFTVDRRDFSVYRLNNRRRPTLIP
jgi:predicted nucleic acid-binding protein